MSSVLIDNLSIGRVIDRINTYKWDDLLFDSYIKNYLYAMILWDDIYTLNGRYSVRTENDQNIVAYDNELGIKRISYDYSSIEIYAQDIENEYWSSNTINEIGDTQDRIDSIFYLILGYNFGINVLLSDQRTEFVEKSNISEHIFSRMDILEIFDKKLLNIITR